MLRHPRLWRILATPPSERSISTQILVWLLLLSTGALLLHGRFDWTLAAAATSWTAFITSLFFFCLLLPATYYGSWELTREPVVPTGIAFAVFIAYSLPCKLLGLDRFRFSETLHSYADPALASKLNLVWAPQAFASLDFAHDFIVLAAAAALAWAVIIGVRRTLPNVVSQPRVDALIILLVVLVLQASLHTGLRSPYVYTPHFEPNHAANYWYHLYMLPDGGGAVNADEPVFLQLDNLFKGAGASDSMLFRRVFENYLASPFVYFASAYNVYLIVNLGFWLAAVLSTFGLLRRLFPEGNVPLYVAALVACGNGFIYYCSQPMSYLAYYASIPIVLYWYERLVCKRGSRNWSATRVGSVMLFGVLLGLGTLTYDLFPLLPFFVVYALFRRKAVTDTLASCLVGMGIYTSYLYVYLDVLRHPANMTNVAYAVGPLQSMHDMFASFSLGAISLRGVGLLTTYVQNLGFAFMLVAFVIALAGVFWSSESRQKVIVALFLVPSILLNTYFYFAGTTWAGVLLISLPRFTYIAYLGVYTAAGIALLRVARWGPTLPWVVIGLVAVWQNIDAFGVPSLGYHFYWPAPAGADQIAVP